MSFIRRQLINRTLLIFFCLSTLPISPKVYAQNQDNPKVKAEAIYKDAQNLINTNSYLAASQQLQQALKLYQQIGDKTGESETLITLGFVSYRQENYRDALNWLQQAEFKISGNTNHRTRLAITQGLVYIELGEFRQGLNLLKSVESSQLDNLAQTNRTRIGIGEAYRYLGLYSQALSYLEISRRTGGERIDFARALNAIGDVYFELGQYDKALDYYQQSFAVRKSIGDRLGMARSLSNLGRINREKGNLQEALNQYKEAVNIANSLGSEGYKIQILNNTGIVYDDLKEKDKALSSFQEALNITRNYPTARVQTLINLGYHHHKQAEYTKAIEYYQEAIAWAKKNSDTQGEAKALSRLGETQLQIKQVDKATPSLEKSIELFESLRLGLRDDEKISFFDIQAYTYSNLQQALVNQGQLDKALTIAERSKARAFVELLAKRLSSQPTAEIKPLTIEEIKKIAKEKQATLVSYSIISNTKARDKEIYIWVINPQGNLTFRHQSLKTDQSEKFIHKNTPTELTSLVSQWRGNVQNKQQGIIENTPFKSSRKAYQILIDPIQDLLPTNPDSPIIFVPQSSLFLIPFSALEDKKGKFLIEKHTIAIAPSIQALSLINKKPLLDKASSLIIGNPSPLPAQLPNLPGAELEAKTIAKFLNVKPLIGGEATKTAVLDKIGTAKIIHFATHGILDDQQGLESSLALVSSKNEDGMLKASEIIDLKLKADLAVLSACDTGRGKITGDGVVGLSRSFMTAGVPSVVVSLWAVPDEPTTELMTEFYKQLQKTPSKAKALRLAMLKTMKDNPTPRDWAGFTLIGQPD
jgi:CHAT domain-containing protein/tetratricopeptide (TPR) repeat protein